jgi:hypothetical protein
MSMPTPPAGIAVDPAAVTAMLRQRHAEQTDGLTYENATLRVALADAQTTIGDLRAKTEELAAELAQAKEAADAEGSKARIQRAAARN